MHDAKFLNRKMLCLRQLNVLYIALLVMNRKKCTAVKGKLAWLASVFCLVAGQSFATNYTWDGNAPGATGNPKWSTANNWSPDTAPPTTVNGLTNADIFFGGNLKTTPQVDNSYFIRSLTFNSGAAAFTLVPMNTEVLSIGVGGIVNNSANIQTINVPIALSNAQSWSASSAALVVNSQVRLGANTLTVSGGSRTTITNIVSGSGGVVRSGTGSLVLSAGNTYTGGTTVNGGKVYANNASGSSATGTGHVTVNSGGVFTGKGFVSGSVTNNSGGRIAPGNDGVGQLTTGSEVWKGGSIFELQMKDVDAGAGIGWDLLNINGSLTITATSGDKMFIDIESLTGSDTHGLVGDFNPLFNYSWTIAKTATGIFFQPGEDANSAISLLTDNFDNVASGSWGLTVLNSGKDLAVTYTAPEPGTWALMGLGGIVFGWFARRRNRA